MKNEDKLYFKQLLNGWLKEIATRTNGKATGENPEQVGDIVDRASAIASRDFEIRMREREFHLMRKIRQTLQSIDHGSFGICEECDEEIPIPRLKARPVTNLCLSCKQKQETTERMMA